MSNFNYDDIELAVLALRGLKRVGYSDQDVRFRLRKAHPDDIIEAAFEHCRNEDASIGGPGTFALRDPSDFYGWYQGPHQNGEFHWPRLKSTLLNKENPWTELMVASLDSASSLVVSNLAPPKSERSAKCKGLVLGYIQSGKTANFSATIAKAVDEGYRLIIVLAGMHNNLRKQTEVRLREELVYPSNQKTCDNLTSDEETGDFNRKQTLSANRSLAKKDGFTLAVVKKNASVLRSLKAWLGDGDPDIIKKCPTLIIDDESDQASINTNKDEQDPTKINQMIRDLFSLFDTISYVGYTATPFANVFINSQDKSDLYPRDFLIALDKPKGYYGPEDLFGRDFVNGRSSTDGMNVIRFVPEMESEHLKENISRRRPIEMVPSLSRAIDSFLLAGAIRILRNQKKNHICMLVHLTHLTDPQHQAKELIEQYIFKIGNQIEDNDQTVKSRLKSLFQSDFSKVSAALLEQNEELNYDTIWKRLQEFSKAVEVLADNSNSSRRLTFDPEALDGRPLWAIVVGGNTLSRGLTLEGLTTSYFVRDSKAYDTLLQMGRWFGYRRGYADLTRIFVTDELFEHFYHLATVEQEIRDEIAVMAANGEKPIDVALRIRKHPSLLITARNRMRSAVSTTLTFGGTKIQTLQINVTDKEIITKNQSAVNILFNSILENKSIRQRIPFRDLENCYLFRGVDVDTVLNFISSISVSPQNAKFDARLVRNYILDCLKSQELNNWSVALMSLKQGSEIEIAGMKVHPFGRRVKHESKNEDGTYDATLRAVSTPGEEIIDLSDKFPSESKSTDEILTPKDGPPISDTLLRNRYRPADRGLLLIYPLQSNTDNASLQTVGNRGEVNTSYELVSADQLFAFSLVFPRSSVATTLGEYMMVDLNKSVKPRNSDTTNSGPIYAPKELITGMKVLNIAQPNAHNVIFNGKNIENRSSATKIRGTIAIYASKTIDRSRFEYQQSGKFVTEDQCAFGSIIGFVDLVDCITEDEVTNKFKKWFHGPYGYVLENVIALEKPIPVSPPRGAIIWWTVSGEDLKKCLKQLPEVVRSKLKPAV